MTPASATTRSTATSLTWYWSHEPGQNVTMAFRILPDDSLAFSKVVSKEGGDWAKMATAHFTTWKRVDN